jgi:hypothetical protein
MDTQLYIHLRQAELRIYTGRLFAARPAARCRDRHKKFGRLKAPTPAELEMIAALARVSRARCWLERLETSAAVALPSRHILTEDSRRPSSSPTW